MTRQKGWHDETSYAHHRRDDVTTITLEASLVGNAGLLASHDHAVSGSVSAGGMPGPP
jgi:hypothetical protein